jgi:hypothetical protein
LPERNGIGCARKFRVRMLENGEIVTAESTFRSIGEPNAIAIFRIVWSVGDNPDSPVLARQYFRAKGQHEVKLLWIGRLIHYSGRRVIQRPWHRSF